MSRFTTIRRLWRIYRKRPHIEISEYGQATAANHHVAVGIHSNTGMMGLGLDFPADDVGHAKAEFYARSLNNITGLPVIDNRERPGRQLQGTD